MPGTRASTRPGGSAGPPGGLFAQLSPRGYRRTYTRGATPMSTKNPPQSRLASVGESLFMLLVLALLFTMVTGYHMNGDGFAPDTSLAAAAENGTLDRLRNAPVEFLDAPDDAGIRPLT